VHEVGSVNQVYPARFCLRQNFVQRLQRRGVGMPNGDGFSLILRAAESQLELLAHSGYFGNIIEERDIPETGTYGCRRKRDSISGERA
jgi:hypothetical protein